jgi:hypothetical protein
MRRRELMGALGALALGCGPRRLPAPPDAPRIVSAAELIPADLDVVARLDLAKMRAALGGVTSDLLSREVLAKGTQGEEAPPPFLIGSLLEADVVYLGYRPSPLLAPLDRVLALQGSFTPLTKAPEGFSGGVDLGADLRYWDRAPGAKLSRTGVARIYALGNRVRAFVSEAELDAVECALEDGAGEGPRRLTAPEAGALSLAARPALLGRLAGGTLRDILQQAKALQLTVDLESDVASLKAALVTASVEDATTLERAGQLVLGRALGEHARRAELSAVSDRVTLSYRVRREALAPLFACLQGGVASVSQCPW